MDKSIAEIAQTVLGIPDLTPQNRDAADFHDLSVWNIRMALEQAYQAGRKSTSDSERLVTQ